MDNTLLGLRGGNTWRQPRPLVAYASGTEKVNVTSDQRDGSNSASVKYYSPVMRIDVKYDNGANWRTQRLRHRSDRARSVENRTGSVESSE